MPRVSATCWATVRLSPVSSTGVRPSPRSREIASGLVGRIASATVMTPRAAPSQATTTAVRPAASASAAARASSGGNPALSPVRRPLSSPVGRSLLPPTGCPLSSPASRVRRPTRTVRPSTVPRTPRPARLVKPSTSDSGPTRSSAPRATARAIGCSEAASTAPPRRSTSSTVVPSAAYASIRVIVPVVTVPVLSSTIVSTLRVDSRTSGPLIRMPSWAPRPVPTSRAVGVARPRAQGQATMSTATAAVKAAVSGKPRAIQVARVARATTMTIGTKTPETRSASRWISALPDWASSTRRAIRASRVSAPIRVARTTSRPPAFTVAPVTVSSGATSTGTDSPVSIEASTADVPATTTPSVAIFSPGRTTNSSPTRRSSIGIRTSAPSRSTATSFAPSSSRARSAAPARRFDRFSM
ncbi:hypothetical protein SDC9_114920 [bioreactor metagenome]|uniref:Uncharacterized protein n=1 Tax=bioreactor metagenome TaxID=1076179 RepID=A0A645C1Z2_9ZZZZ